MESEEGETVALAVTPVAEETPVLKAHIVEEVLTRLRRGEGVRAVARTYGIDPKTVRVWRQRQAYRARMGRAGSPTLAPFAEWVAARAPEVDYNAAVLHRELVARGFTGSAVIVRRYVRPLRRAATLPARATMRFETGPGQQAQVDFGQRRLWIGDAYVPAHLFVFTLGYSRRCYPVAFTHERLDAVLAGHEQAFAHFGGVPEMIVVDNAKAAVLRHDRTHTLWHPVYADFAGYYGFRAWAHWPHRPQTKGKVESGVKYVKRNALAGKRFGSWTHLNTWLLEWATTVADTRVHGTTHEVPLARFAQEALRPLDGRPPYQRERVQHRVVATDALVAIRGSRYSVPVRYAGATVVVRECAAAYEILHAETVIARHARLGRHQVAMEPAHYAGLRRSEARLLPPAPPRWDPGYPASGTVRVRDLAEYDTVADPLGDLVEMGGGA